LFYCNKWLFLNANLGLCRHIAIKNELDDVALILIAYGADPTVLIEGDKTIFDTASERFKRQISMSICLNKLLFKDGKRIRVAVSG